MDEAEIIEIVREALMMIIHLGIPPMLIGLVVGVTIALFQALTQVQEITLVFVPKILAIFFTVFMFFPVMAEMMTVYMETIADRITAIN